MNRYIINRTDEFFKFCAKYPNIEFNRIGTLWAEFCTTPLIASQIAKDFPALAIRQA